MRITNTPERERVPRTYDGRIVWENMTTGEVMYVPRPGTRPVVIDQGRQPDINQNWIVYAKDEPSPDPGCHWRSHTQLWAYGPLSSSAPRTLRISGVNYWGAANYIRPRLTKDYVVFLADYLYAHKTVVGIYPIAAFGNANVAMLEVDDAGDASHFEANVDAWQESGPVVHVLYRHRATQSAKLRCCRP